MNDLTYFSSKSNANANQFNETRYKLHQHSLINVLNTLQSYTATNDYRTAR